MKSRLDHNTVYLMTFLASLLISAIVFWQRGIVNYDGVLYIDTAKTFVESGLSAAFATFNWPLYSILIGITHLTTGFSYEISAHFLNAILTALLCTAFVATYYAIGQQQTRTWFAAILILGLPALNGYRDLVIRDFGYWAFSLIALLYFIKFVHTSNVRHATLWQVAVILAISFRIEGIVYFLAPAVLFLVGPARTADRFINVFRSSYLFFALAIIGLMAILATNQQLVTRDTGTLQLWISYISPVSMIDGLHAQSLRLNEQLVHLSSTSDAALILLTGLLSLAVFKVAINAVPAYLLVSAYGIRKQWLSGNQANRITLFFFALAFSAILALLASKYFVSSRYTVTAVLFLSLLTFQHVDIAFQKLARTRKRHWHIVGWLAIAVIFLDGVISLGSPKTIIRTGAQWTLENLDQSKPCLTNEARLRFYTNNRCQHVPTERLVASLRPGETGSQPGHLFVWHDRQSKLVSELAKNTAGLQTIKEWKNSKGDRVTIYQTTHLPQTHRK
jgi:hypothetical protein